jgi:putative flippase GtrA
MLRLRSFLRFLVCSGIATLISMAVFELLRRIVDVQQLLVHVAVVAIAYFAAARANFEMQQRWVFSDVVRRGTGMPFHVFVIGNGTMSLLVGAVSAALVRWPGFVATLGSSAALASVVLAAAAISPFSYLLLRHLNLAAGAGAAQKCAT